MKTPSIIETMLKFAVVLLLAGAPTILYAQNVVVPNGLAGVEGNLNNGFPFNLSNNGLTMQRYQQVYGAGEFSSVVGPKLITTITFRPDGDTGSAFASTITDIQINLSTTSAAVDALSTTFASNIGGDDTIVFSGALSLSSSSSGGPPRNFDIVINLSTPFLYDPANGNLLLDVRNFSGESTTQFDAENTSGDGTSRIFTVGSGVSSPTADGADTIGLVTQFTFAAVPEPSTIALTSVGVVGIANLLRRRYKTKKK